MKKLINHAGKALENRRELKWYIPLRRNYILINVFIFFLLLFLKLVDDTNIITNARFSVCRCWQGWELVTFLKGTGDESESTYWSGFSAAAEAFAWQRHQKLQPPPASPWASCRARPRPPAVCEGSGGGGGGEGELGAGEFKTPAGRGPRRLKHNAKGLITTLAFIPEGSRDSSRKGRQWSRKGYLEEERGEGKGRGLRDSILKKY